MSSSTLPEYLKPMYIEGHRWFGRMKNKTYNGTNVKGLLADNAPDDMGVIILWERNFNVSKKGYPDYGQYHAPIKDIDGNVTNKHPRHYTTFNNIYSVRNFVYGVKYPIAKTFYEIIKGERRSRIYFDIDFEMPVGSNDVDFHNAELIHKSTMCISWALEDYGIPVEDQRVENWYIMSSNRGPSVKPNGDPKAGKISLHIVLPFCMDTNEGRKEFAFHVNKFGDELGFTSPRLVDMNVYSQLQAFRMLGSHKADNKGKYTKCFNPVWYFGNDGEEITTQLIDEDYVDTSGDKRNKWLLVTSMANFVYSSFRTIQPKVGKIKRTYGPSTEFTEDQITNIKSMVINTDPGMELGEDKDGVVCFKRTCPSFCNICERTHDAESKYAVIHKKEVRLYCRRACSEHDTGPDVDHPIPAPYELVGSL